VQRGISDACESSNIYVLGGDTNFSSHLQFGACAFGLIKDGRTISRVGCKEGDILYSSGYLGSGNGYAFSKLLNNSREKNPEICFKPASRVIEGRIIRNYASCCMDTSDGEIAALDQLMRLNKVGFAIESDLIQYIEPNTFELCQSAGLAPWLTLAGLHGEFELIFTVPKDIVDKFLQEANSINWKPINLGKVIKEQEVRINLYDKLIPLDTCMIRNLFSEVKGNVKDYLRELIKIDESLKSYSSNESSLSLGKVTQTEES
jgi:thiamine-monophosphate kinase